MSNIPRTTTPSASTPSEIAWPWRRAPGDDGRTAAARVARHRGAVQAAVAFAVATLLLLWKPILAAVVASIALVVLALALVSPLGGFARLERGVERFAHGVGLAVTWLLMPILFYLLFLPAGLLLRRGKLRFTGNPDRDEATYWQHRDAQTGDAGGWQKDGLPSYRRQF
jgi:hypothetical protein